MHYNLINNCLYTYNLIYFEFLERVMPLSYGPR